MSSDEAAIERMARALYDDDCIDTEPPWEGMTSAYREDVYLRQMRLVLAALLDGPLPPAVVRAVLAQIREPTQAMESAAERAGDEEGYGDITILDARLVWHAMIDAKLAELDAEARDG